MIKRSMQAIISLLRAMNTAVLSGAAAVPELIEELIKTVVEWAGLLLLFLIFIFILDVILAILTIR